MDYAGNSKKDKVVGVPKQTKVTKNIEKVVTGEVVIHKKSLGRKIKELFIQADFGTVARGIAYDTLIPAARNMVVDAANKGVERVVYGESAIRRREYGQGPRITYNSPVNRGNPYPSGRTNMPQRRVQNRVPLENRSARHQRDDFILSSKEEADLVVERMQDIIDNYEVVTVADLNDLLGLPTNYVDDMWGWLSLGNVQVQQIREGYLINLPSAEPI